jgi:protein-disulfide isomerase
MTEETEKKKSETITIRKDDLWKYSTIALVAIVILGLVFGFPGSGSADANVVADSSPPSAGANARVEMKVEDSYFKGSADAPVTVVEFSDFECPFCEKFYTETFPSIKSEYIDTGKVKFVYKHFPLGFHQNAQKAAEATECAGELGGNDAFYAMHDAIFEGGTRTLSVDKYKEYASEIGLDTSSFDTCLDSGKYGQAVQDDLKVGSSKGVRGTPAFFIGNDEDGYVLLSGAQPFAAFQQVIEKELA